MNEEHIAKKDNLKEDETIEVSLPSEDKIEEATSSDEAKKGVNSSDKDEEATPPGDAEEMASSEGEGVVDEASEVSEKPEEDLQDDPTKGMKWFIVNAQSQYENFAKKSLEERIKKLKMEKHFGQVLVPSEIRDQVVKGKKRQVTKKHFPGYIIIQMHFNDESWHMVHNTPKITGFVGDKTNPPSLSDEEVIRLTGQLKDGFSKSVRSVGFEKGESVRVTDGPFSNFNGVVEEVNPDKGKVKVLVSIFGRSTPVELDFTQIERNE